MDAFERDLAARLRRADRAVPPAVDAAILGAAAEAAAHFRRRNRLRLVRIGGTAAAAAAAAWVLALGLGTRLEPETASMASLPTPRFGIADAWRAARGLAADEGRLDLDGDGAVDARDADQILARIVDLDAPRRNS